jgi:hypothetical protein
VQEVYVSLNPVCRCKHSIQEEEEEEDPYTSKLDLNVRKELVKMLYLA